MKTLVHTLIVTLLGLFISLAQAQPPSVEGQWRTIDDDTGEARSIVLVWVQNGEMQGPILELLNRSEPNPLCTACSGSRKDQPIEGMTFIWGLSQDDDEWTGGRIVDPSNGREYRARAKLTDNGSKLEVRGFVGFALIGRTQTWERVE